jgi:short-subunit dehydrogenase
MMDQYLPGTSVVITGASSGIGRAAALAFAHRGARVALAARRAGPLHDVASKCRRIGGDAIAVATDVTDAEAVAQLAQAAERAFGRIDVWINNAGTGVFGAYTNADVALHRRIIEVNLLGSMHGVATVLPIFLRQGHGALINNISMGGWSPVPFAAAYTASKFGLRGFTASLRQELADHPGVHVCGVFPSMIDTPGFVHGANMSGRQIHPGPMHYAPEDVAETFVALMHAPRDEVAVGWPARAAQVAYALAPAVTEHGMGAFMRFVLKRAAPAPREEGTVMAPAPVGKKASGGWRDAKGLPSASTISRIAGMALLAGAALLIGTRASAKARRR